MEEITTQIKTLLEGKKNILIVSHQKIDGDGLSSMLVLKKLFERMDKEVTALSMDDIPEIYHFLPGVNEVERTLRSSNDFIISLKTEGVEVDKLKYSVDGDTLNIVVSPKKGVFAPENIAARQAIGKYDLIFVLDSGDLEHLGTFYEEHTEMFYETPIVNIDHHTTNTAFGQMNIVDVMAASTTQIVYQLTREMMNGEESLQNFFDANIATLLLTGLIVDTGSFQHTNTSPKSLELAADLIEMGARQQEIIQNIYKTKQLSTLKLWGRVLAKIEEDPIHKIVWSTITKEDLQETGASVEEAEGLIDELMTNAPGAEIVALMKNSFDGAMTCSLRSTNVTIDTLPVANHFGGGGHKQASGFKQKGHNFNLFTADVIEFIEKYQEERLGLAEDDVAMLREEYNAKQKQREVTSQHKYEEVKGSEKLDIISEISEKAEEGRVEIRRVEANKKAEGQRVESPKSEVESPKKHHPKQQKQSVNTDKTEQHQVQQPAKKHHPQQQKQGEKKLQTQPAVKKEEVSIQVETPMLVNQADVVDISSEAPVEVTSVVQTPVGQEVPIMKESPADAPSEQVPVAQEASSVAQIPAVESVLEARQEVAIEPVFEDYEATTADETNFLESVPQETSQMASVETSYQADPVQQQAPQYSEEQMAQYQAYQAQQAQYQQQHVQYAQQQAQPVQQQQTQVTKEQAGQYAQYYAQQLHQMNPQTPEYAQVYQYYSYYAQMAQ